MHQQATGTGEAHPFIIPLTKIDVEKRLVIGTAAEEIADKSREIMDYASARPQFERWSKEFSDATGGLSKGNLRVMHTKHVAGRLDDIAYDDDTRKVQIVAKVVDDNDWQKCLDGVYTGFSIGGGYLKKWKDPDSGLTRYTPIISEISLVDNPCMPSAKFAELVKADGIVGQVALVGKVHTFAEQWAERPAPVPTFSETWSTRPQTFGELHKGFDESKHRRNHGKFTSSNGGGKGVVPFEHSDATTKIYPPGTGPKGPSGRGPTGGSEAFARFHQKLNNLNGRVNVAVAQAYAGKTDEVGKLLNEGLGHAKAAGRKAYETGMRTGMVGRGLWRLASLRTKLGVGTGLLGAATMPGRYLRDYTYDHDGSPGKGAEAAGAISDAANVVDRGILFGAGAAKVASKLVSQTLPKKFQRFGRIASATIGAGVGSLAAYDEADDKLKHFAARKTRRAARAEAVKSLKAARKEHEEGRPSNAVDLITQRIFQRGKVGSP